MVWFILFIYIALSIAAFFLVHHFPRKPFSDPPDWGVVEDVIIPAENGGYLNCWKIVPQKEKQGTVIMAHGWGRNRDKMTSRAKTFGLMGYEVIIPDMRDHGNSSRLLFPNAMTFGEDILSVMATLGGKVVLYGHSAGAAGSVFAASKCPEKVDFLILEGCYTKTPEALFRLYCAFNRFFGLVFGWLIILEMRLFYGKGFTNSSPCILAGEIDLPVLLIHAELDEKFPVKWVWELEKAFPAGRANVYIQKGATHTEAGEKPECKKAVSVFVSRIISFAPYADRVKMNGVQ